MSIVVSAVLATLATPAAASAHGLVGRADLPLPGYLFFWGAAAVLAISFAAIAALWRRPILQEVSGRAIAPRLGRVLTSRAVDVACGAIGVALLGVVLWSAFWGVWPTNDNFAQVWVFIVVWVGFVPLSVLFGDFYRAFNPFRALGRAFGWLVAKVGGGDATDPLPYPDRLGYWPATFGLYLFGLLELAYNPTAAELGVAVLIYGAIQFIGMGLYGTEVWSRRGDGMAVYFNLFARIGPWGTDDRRLVLRRPLSGLANWPALNGSVALFAVLIGTVTFDGASSGPLWQNMLDPLKAFWAPISLGLEPIELASATGMLVCILLVGAFYSLGTLGARTAGGGHTAKELRRKFIHSLAPISLAYAGAHYFSLLVYSGQLIWSVSSNPLGRGWDLFGTADRGIDYSIIDTNGIWWVQLTLVVVGHILALSLAHDRALAIYGDSRQATRSQFWMLGVMVGFTVLALWLLHTAAYNP